MTMTRWTGAVVAAAWMALGGCAVPEDEVELESTEATASPAIWDPQPINPAMCNPEEPLPTRPPDPGGHCDIEVRISAMTFASGQGVSEGKGEIRGIFTASTTNEESETEVTVAVAPQQDYSAGQSQGMSLDLGTYRVEVGETRDVEICASFAEDDNGGTNGNDDFSSPCTIVTLGCDAQDGQPSFKPPLGPEPFCETLSDGEVRCNGSMGATISVMRTDADLDQIPNEDDFTPELCDEELKGTGGIAALVYFHYDDNGLITLGQSLWTNLSHVYDAYDYVVLVADNATSNPENTSAAAWRLADRVFPPTRPGLLDAMQDLTSRHYRWDAFIHAHGYKRSPTDSEFEAMPGPDHVEGDLFRISGQWLESATDADDIGTADAGIPIIAWWSTTCIAARQIDSWISLGALTASGAIDVQFRPNAWPHFADLWIGGARYRDAVDGSVTPGVIQASESLIGWQGSLPPWLCTNGDSVLFGGTCADDFFLDTDGDGPDEAEYNLSAVYDPALSGAENMAVSSERTFVGDFGITFGAAGRTWPRGP